MVPPPTAAPDESANANTRITLRPPEWTSPAIKPERRVSAPPPPLERREGEHAAEGAMRARLETARAAGDHAVEADAASRLARWLASRDRGLDEATALARRVLEIADDGELRMELASWLESLGEGVAAADALRPLAIAPDVDPGDAAQVLVRIGVLLARAGDGKGASDALAKATALSPADALAGELRGTIAVWAPHVVTPAEAAECYVEAAARRLAAGALDAQFEDLLRAFDVDATSSVAVAALASALVERGKALAADEVWRAHASALRASEPKRATTIHARRRLQARAAGDMARGFGAALDEGLDAQFQGDAADVMDDLLLRVGLLEPLAARLELRAEGAKGAERARILEELARLYAGPLASAERAAFARISALAADPGCDDALVALRAHASATRDATLLVEGLIRGVGETEGLAADDVRRPAKVACARALAALAEDQLSDDALAMWAFQSIRRIEPRDAAAGAGLARHTGGHAALVDQLRGLRQALDESTPAERVEALRSAAALLRSMPDRADLAVTILSELVERLPDDRRWRAEAYRLAWRRSDYEEIARLARDQFERARAPEFRRSQHDDRIDARITFAAASRALGDVAAANAATCALLTEAPGHRGAAGAAWVNAALANDGPTRAAAMEQLAVSCAAPVRAVMMAIASDLHVSAGNVGEARRVAELGCQADPTSARSVVALAGVVLGSHDRTAASALERGINMVCARSSWCRALAEALDAMGELGYAIGWTQRFVALRPGDRAGAETLVRRILRARDGARLADALAWILSQAQPAGPLAELVARALRDLVPLDSDRAVVLARRALDAFGARSHDLREAMIEVADVARDDAFAALVIERALAVDFSAERHELVAALVQRRSALRDGDGEARALARAMREGVRSAELETRVQALAQVKLSGDGELARLEAVAEGLMTSADRARAALAWRELGAALWDLADDRVGAVRAWLRSAKLAPYRGYMTLGVDLARFAGSRYALDCLAELIEKEPDRARSGSVAAEAARAALALNEPARALDLACIALERNPAHADALELAENGALGAARPEDMSRLYDGLGGRALGRFGRRAAHYRGARFFEQHGDPGLALKHAAQAFTAVPSEGATLILLKRTAERADDRAQAVRTIVGVADAAASNAVRAGWLLRAASITTADEEGARLRVDVLLRAILLAPDLGTLAMLEEAARDLVRATPEESDAVQLRLARASRTVTAKADGPEGGRVALAFALLSLDLFDDASSAQNCIERAMKADADLDEYGKLARYASRLAHGEEAETVLARLLAITDKPYANVGVPALKLLAAMTMARGERGAHARLTVMAAERDKEDEALLREADAVVNVIGDEVLLARLRKVAPDARRAEVWRAMAHAKMLDGAHDEAIRALERVTELVGDDARPEVEREIRAAYEAAGRAEEVEDRALRDATNAGLAPALRAARWAEVAQQREARGELVGAVDALQAAASLDGAPIERWSTLERVAELANLDDVRVGAIREIAARVDEGARAAVQKRLARAYEARENGPAAEATWQSILDADPSDEEADYALEGLITARADYSDLANHLGHRATRLSQHSGTREALRAVRLRRAAILEQRLSRIEDACEELQLVLRESPDNASAMSYLADLHERMGEFGRAAPLWKRVSALSRDPATQNELELRAARAAIAAKDYAGALTLAKNVLERDPGAEDAAQLRVDAARALRDDRELGDALEDVALRSSDDAVMRSDALVEASHASARVGDKVSALSRAQRAARLSPDRASTQLLARQLEYRVRGAGTPEDAKRAIDELSRLKGMRRDEAAMQAFLLAEALDAVQGGGAGVKVLTERQTDIGTHPLIALGLAERLVAQFNFAGALPHFQAALLGDIAGMRDRGRVALAAAEAAIRADRPDAALSLLDDAASEPATRSAALMRAAQLATAQGNRARAQSILRDLAESTAGDESARALAQLSRMLAASKNESEREEADHALERAILAASPDGALRVQLTGERDTRRASPSAVEERAVRAPPPLPAPLEEPAAPSVPLVAEPPTAGQITAAATIVEVAPAPSSRRTPRAVEEPPAKDMSPLTAAVKDAANPEDRSRARIALARAHLEQGAYGAAELCLHEGLAEGGLPEGDFLASMLESTPERAPELVKVRRRQVDLVPGDLTHLEGLRAAAVLDHNPIYARAVEHVARAFDPGAGPLPPPPLACQDEQPGMLAMLTRGSNDRVGQAFALVWDAAHASLSRHALTYAMNGTERVLPGSASTLARIYETAVRLLDVPRIPLFVRRMAVPLTPSVALLWPAAAVITGYPNDDTPELRFTLGQALSAALPQNAIFMGLPEPEARVVWNAVLGAFGPPESSRQLDQASGKLAETFWQSIAPRTQRRLQELLAPASAADFAPAVERARQCGRRMGLFLTGDFGVAARSLVLDASTPDKPLTIESANLRELSSKMPALADLLRLAVAPEYADARWHPVPPASQRGSLTGGRLSTF